MRLVIDSLIALMLVGVLAGVVFYHQTSQAVIDRQATVHEALSELYEKALLHGATAEAKTDAGFPLLLDPDWFNPLPVNAAVDPSQPWVDVAPPGDRQDHPPDPIITRPDQAGFWYNPNRGMIRARVPSQFTDREALDLYNLLNNTALKQLPIDHDEQRKPRSLERLQSPPNADNGETAGAPRRRTLNDVAPKR